MSRYIIQGGHKLKGEITTNSSKNAALGLLAASLLNKGITTLNNFPHLEETQRIIEVLLSIGVQVNWLAERTLQIVPPKKFDLSKIDQGAALKTRSILLLIGPLLHHLERFGLPKAGGCKLGKRSSFPHCLVAKAFGAKIVSTDQAYVISRQVLKHPKNLVLYESGDTVTENAIVLAAGLADTTTIAMASANYQVQEVCFYLEKLGVKFSGIGTTTLQITGLASIKKDVTYSLAEDPIESMMFLSIAATTNSVITIKRCPIDFLELELCKLQVMGFKFKLSARYKSANNRTDLVDIKCLGGSLKALPDKIYGRPYPGLNIDNLPFFVPVACMSKGRTFIHDWAYENRAMYFLEFAKLGANMTLLDQHRFYIEGPTVLKATTIICPPALRPSAVLLVAMLAAKGQSVLENVYAIERGYEDLCQRLSKLGANISKEI